MRHSHGCRLPRAPRICTQLNRGPSGSPSRRRGRGRTASRGRRAARPHLAPGLRSLTLARCVGGEGCVCVAGTVCAQRAACTTLQSCRMHRVHPHGPEHLHVEPINTCRYAMQGMHPHSCISNTCNVCHANACRASPAYDGCLLGHCRRIVPPAARAPAGQHWRLCRPLQGEAGAPPAVGHWAAAAAGRSRCACPSSGCRRRCSWDRSRHAQCCCWPAGVRPGDHPGILQAANYIQCSSPPALPCVRNRPLMFTTVVSSHTHLRRAALTVRVCMPPRPCLAVPWGGPADPAACTPWPPPMCCDGAAARPRAWPQAQAQKRQAPGGRAAGQAAQGSRQPPASTGLKEAEGEEDERPQMVSYVGGARRGGGRV